MIKIHTNQNEAENLRLALLNAIRRENNTFNTWKVEKRKFVGSDEYKDFVVHKEEQWQNVGLFMAVIADNVLRISSVLHGEDRDAFNSKKPHVEGRFASAIISNMLNEFIKIEFIKD